MNLKSILSLFPHLNSQFTPSQSADILGFIGKAGQIAVEMRNQGFQVDEKGIDDRVTNVDRAIDRLIVEKFQQWFSNDIVISEENRLTQKLWQQNDAQLAQSRIWFVDPIDGTEDFIEGRENYAVMLGLLKNYQPIMGWVYAPAANRFYFGGNATNEDKVLHGVYANFNPNSNCDDADSSFQLIYPEQPAADSYQVILSEKDEAAYGSAICSAIPQAEFYSLGSFGLKVMEVVLGKASMYIYLNRRVKLWDTVGPLAIARGAGLVCCDLEGNDIGFTHDAIEPDTLIHKQVIIVGWKDFLDRFRPQLAEALRSL
jgi:3'(2'), 5'-bisphosphate nucleotidase